MEFIGLFIFLAGFVVGLGAVTVIDIHGFLGRKSTYWTETTIRAHKVTKPLIWIGIFLAIIGGFFLYNSEPFRGIAVVHAILAVVLIFNGCFLSFYISPILLKREKAGLARELLPKKLQKYIAVSFLFSFAGWWGSLVLLAWYITH